MNGPARGTILHLIDTGGPGGAETVFLRVAAGLESRGWKSIPVVNRDAWLAEQLRGAGLDPVILDSRGSLQVGYLRRLVGLVRSSGAGAILAHLYGSAVYGILAGTLTRRPTACVFHGQSDITFGGRFDKLKARIVARGAARLVAVSGPLRDTLAPALRAKPSMWEVVPNGVNTKLLQPGRSSGLRERLGIRPETILVGALGNIRRPKAYDVFLATAARLAETGPECRFVIAGEGSGALAAELTALRARLGLEQRVEFVGLQTDIAGYLGELDLLLLTSATEGFSIACVEAMACGLPVVATRSGGPEDIVVDGETGLLCPVGDARALAAAVARLAADPATRRRMGQAGRARAEQLFGLEAMVARYDQLLLEMLGRTGADGA